MHAKIWSLYILRFKSYSEGWSWQQTDKQTGQKQYAPDHSIRGIKIFWLGEATFPPMIAGLEPSVLQDRMSILSGEWMSELVA